MIKSNNCRDVSTGDKCENAQWWEVFNSLGIQKTICKYRYMWCAHKQQCNTKHNRHFCKCEQNGDVI